MTSSAIKKLVLFLLLLPTIASADFTTPLKATSTTQGWVSPARINGVEQAIVGTYFVGTSTATSTFAGGIAAAALGITGSSTLNGVRLNTLTVAGNSTSTFRSGIDLGSGCFAVGGVCVTGLGGTVTQINTTWPILGGPITTSGTLTWGGLSTTTPWNTSQLAYVINGNTIAGVSTSTVTATSPLTGSFTVVGTGGSVGCQTASGSQAGCLAAVDFTSFTNKINFYDWMKTPAGDAITPTTTVGIIVNASSTIGNGTTVTGLTISGTGTTTGPANFANDKFRISSIGRIDRIDNTSVSITASSLQLSSSGSDLLIQNNVSTVGSGIKLQVGGSALNTDRTSALKFFVGTIERARIDGSGGFGYGTTTPYAEFAIHTPLGSTGATTTLFAIASSTPTATTTLFSISNVGAIQTMLSDGCVQVSGLNLTSTGVACGSSGGGLSGYDAWTHPSAGVSATTSSIIINNATSTITNLTMVNSTSTNATTTSLYVSSTGTSTLIVGGASTTGLRVGNFTIAGNGTSTNAGSELVAGGYRGLYINITGSATSTATDLSLTHLNVTATSSLTGLRIPLGGLEVSNLAACNNTNVLMTDAGGAVFCGAAPAASLSGGAANKVTFWTGASSVSNNSLFSWNDAAQKFGVGTSSPFWNVQLASTSPQLAITNPLGPIDGKHWLFSALGDGRFMIGTSSDSLTSTTSIITINQLGYVGVGTTSPSKPFEVSGNLSGGIMRVRRIAAGVANGVFGTYDIALANNSSAVDLTGPALTFSYGQGINDVSPIADIFAQRSGADNSGLFGFRTYFLGNTVSIFTATPGAKSGFGTSTPNWLLQLASSSPQLALTNPLAITDSKHWLFSVLGSGSFNIATGSDSLLSTSSPLFTIFPNGNVGIGSSTPFYKLTVATGTIMTPERNIAASGGTSTSQTIDWKLGNKQLFQMGTANVTFTFSNYLPGASLRLQVCNPQTGTAGTLTWPNAGVLRWYGATTSPPNTTTAGFCDRYEFDVTQGTSTNPNNFIVTGIQMPGLD